MTHYTTLYHTIGIKIEDDDNWIDNLEEICNNMDPSVANSDKNTGIVYSVLLCIVYSV